MAMTAIPSMATVSSQESANVTSDIRDQAAETVSCCQVANMDIAPRASPVTVTLAGTLTWVNIYSRIISSILQVRNVL